MLRFATPLVLLCLALATPLAAQTVTVETIVPRNSTIDDALTIGPDGALYGTRWGSTSSTVTRVDLDTGTTSIYATGFVRSNGLAFTPDGSLYVASYGQGRIVRIAPGGAKTTFHQEDPITSLSGVAYDAVNDVLYITSYDSDFLKRLTLAGDATEISAEGLDGPAGLAFDDQNRLYVANFDDGKIFRLDGRSLTEIADLPGQVGFIAYGGGRLFATGINTHVVYEVSLTGAVTTLAGTGAPGLEDGPGTTAQFNGPNGIVANAAGDTLYVSDSKTRAIRRIAIQTSTDVDGAPGETGALLPVSPNPAASSTTVRFDLGVAQSIELALYDALGRRVRSLASGLRAAGQHTVPVSAEGLAPGIYMVTLRTGDKVESRQLVRH